jgi:hypothetical protein
MALRSFFVQVVNAGPDLKSAGQDPALRTLLLNTPENGIYANPAVASRALA